MKNVILLITVLCVSFSSQAQIIKDAVLTNRPKPVTPVITAKADKLVLDMVQNLTDGSFNMSMASLKTYPNRVGYSDYSIPLTSKPNKLFNAKKFDDLTVEGAFQLSDSKQAAAGIKIFTTKLGGKKMTILYAEGPNAGLIPISNIVIEKNGNNRYIITGNTDIDGVFTSYVVHIFRNVN